MRQLKRVPLARVRALWRKVSVHLIVAAIAGVVAGAFGLLAVSWVAGRVGILQRPSPVPLILWLLVAGSLGLWIWSLVRRLIGWDYQAAAAEIERRTKLPRGSLQGAVEPGIERPGTSLSLLELHREQIGRELEREQPGGFGDRFARSARVRASAAMVLAVSALLATVALWVEAGPAAEEAWAALLHPVRNVSIPPLPPIRLVGAAERVSRGEALAVRISAPARDSVQLVWQPSGEIAQGRWLGVSGGNAASVVPRVESTTLYWASAADGAVSDTLQVEPVDPLLLLDVQVTLRYPLHTKRDLEILSAPLPVMSVPAGTRTTISAKTTRPVAEPSLRSSTGDLIRFDVLDDRRFSRTFVVRDGVWAWDIVGAEGDTLEGSVDSLRFITVRDSAPNVQIVYPGADTILDVDMTQPLVIDLRDDYGLSRAELVSWRMSAWGERWPDAVESLALTDDASRANVTALLDARGRGFLPGDTLHYYVRAFDNAAEPQEGRSREYILRLPDLDELRQRTLAQTKELVESAEQLAESARDQQEATEALQRATEVSPTPGPTNGTGAEEEGVEFSETEAARQALEEANELLQSAEEIQEALRDLQEAIERSGLNDQSVQERLQEIEALYRRILTPELEEKLEALREALVELDPEQIRESIRELAEGSADFRQRVEQSVELLERAALEHEFQTLETQAEDLANEQEQLAEAAADPDSLADALQQLAEQLAAQSDSLADRIDQFADELNEAGEMQAGDQASEAQRAASEASQADAQAAQQMGERPQEAARSAQRASQQMQQASASLQQGRQQMQEDWRQEVVEALDRASTEALELARRQRELNKRLNQSNADEQGELRSDEVALRRGLDQIQQQLSEAMESTLLIDPQLLGAAAQTEAAMDELLEQLSDGARRRRASQGLAGQVSEGLNELAYRLMEASEAAGSAESGTGMQEALEQLGQLAEQQGEVNSQSGGVSPGGLTEALLQQMQQIGAQQRGIAQELRNLDQSLGPRGQVLGELEKLADEAEDIADQLQAGRLDEELLERQGQLFKRLLDAGRTLE